MMIETKAIFRSKENTSETWDCTISKVIRLPGAAFDSFSRSLIRDHDFIKESNESGYPADGKRHCLLVIGEGRRDGILVDSQGYNYARYTAHIPNAEAFLIAEQYPALTKFNKKLADIADYIAGSDASANHTAETDRAESPQIRYEVDLQDLDAKFGIDLMYNNAVLNTVLDMLESKPEIKDLELDKNQLIIYQDLDGNMLTAEPISDPSVTFTDMHAYGYASDGMIPLGKERAAELFDQGHEIYRLYEDDTEGAVESREEIENFDGMLGIEGPAPQVGTELSIDVFILNHERYNKGEGEHAGEWLSLPADADTLRGLFERIGFDSPQQAENAVTAVRMPLYDYLRDHISKHDSIDELNMLASYMSGIEDHEIEKLEAILSTKVADIGRGVQALINLLVEDNFTAFDFIHAKNEEELGHWYAVTNDEKPDGVSFEDYGRECVKSEGGKFAGKGYIKHMHKEVAREYDGVVSDEYKIVSKAFEGMGQKVHKRGPKERAQGNRSGGKPSVMDEIKASRETAAEPKPSGERTQKKNKEEPDL